MSILLYDLCGRDDRRFSPYCWRIRMALAHKGLEYRTRPVAFTAIAGIGDGSYKTVPVIDDDGRMIADSLVIADYLEQHYPNRPSLFGGAAGRALTEFVQQWVNRVLHPGLIRLVVKDIHDRLRPEDRVYFRDTREQRFGQPLEAVQAEREQRLDGVRQSLQPLRATLRQQPFLGGETPLYADYLVFGAFQWVRVVSPLRLLEDDDLIGEWFERCLDLHEGSGRAQPAAARDVR